MKTTATATFLAALTATDRLSKTERQRHANAERAKAKQKLHDERYEAWMRATAAFHTLEAARLLACLARVRQLANRHERDADEKAAAIVFLAMADRYMGLPCRTQDDRKERAVLIRQWGKGRQEAVAEWQQMADTAQEGC